MLDPGRSATDNPFTHDRIKTAQPRILWEWLLKLAVILFVLDVGVRRIDLDREEWRKATAVARRWIFFWTGRRARRRRTNRWRTLLAGADEVRSNATAAGAEARPELFQAGAGGPARCTPGVRRGIANADRGSAGPDLGAANAAGAAVQHRKPIAGGEEEKARRRGDRP